MGKIRILHLRKSEGIYGAEKVIISLSEGNRDSYVAVVGCIYDLRHPVLDLVVEAQQKGVAAETIICKSRFDLRTLVHIIFLIRKWKIDIIHSHGFKADVYGWLATRWTHTPIVATKHGWTSSNSMIRLWEWVDMFFLKFFDQLVAVSEDVKHKLVTKRIPEYRVKMISNGVGVRTVEPQEITSIRTELGLKKTNQVVGIVGRLSIEKGHRFFLEAAKQIIKEVPSARFLIVGEGPLRNELEEYTSFLNLKRIVFFAGYRSDAEKIYHLMDVVVSSSLREGLPLTLLEAMAAAKPVVATSVGGVNNLIQHSKNGFLVPPEDPDSIAQYVIELLKNNELRIKVGKEALKVIQEKYSSEKMVEAYTLLYRNLSGKKEF